MTVISGKELRTLILNDKVIQNMIDPELQIQTNGVDLTVKEISRLITSGTLDFSNESRRLSEIKEISFIKNYIYLDQGVYEIKFNEFICIPTNLCTIFRSRSSLLRCGASIQSALGDSGYIGAFMSLLYVPFTGLRLIKIARLGQLVFLKTTGNQEYNGIYQEYNGICQETEVNK